MAMVRLFACLLALLMTTQAAAVEPLELIGLVHDDRALNRAHDVELQGNYAFVAGKGGSLAIIDVTDAANPKLVSSLVDAKVLEDAQTVLPMGDILLLGARDLLAIDIRNLQKPFIAAKVSDRPRIDRINGMARRGNFVFAANKSGYIDVFDVSNLAKPKLHDVLNTRDRGGVQSPHDIAIKGDRIYLVDAAHHGPVHLRIYQIIDAQSGKLLPAEQWKIEGAVISNGRLGDDLGGANRVVLGGKFAYLGAFVRGHVGVIDVSNPAKPIRKAVLPVADIAGTGMTIAGKILFVAGGEAVEAIDISNPARPVSLAAYRGGRLFPTRRKMLHGTARFDNAHDLVYRDGLLYVTAQNDNNLGILKINDPRILKLVK